MLVMATDLAAGEVVESRQVLCVWVSGSVYPQGEMAS